MSSSIQRRRGTTSDHSTFTGAVGEITIDTTKDTVVVHDGVGVGGFPLLREDGSNSGLALGSAGAPSLKFVGDGNTGIFSPGADQVAISTNGTGRVFVDSSGNIGIATSTPNTQGYGGSVLGIFGSGNNGGNIWLTSETTAAGNRTGRIGFGTEGNTVSKETARIWSLADGSTAGNLGGNLLFNTKSDGGALTERMRLDSSGRLGLGTSSPGAKLEVAGDVIFNGGGVQFPIQFANAFTPNSQRADLLFSANATSNNAFRVGTIASNGGVTLQGTRQSDSSQKVNLVLQPDGGSVGIGTTSPSSSLVVSNGGANGIEFGPLHGDIFTYNRSTSAYTNTQITCNEFVVRTNGSNERARIDTSGRLLVGTSDGSGGVSKLIVQGASNGSAVGVAQISYNGLSSAALATDTDIGYLRFTDQGSNSGVFAQITASTDGTTGANDYPGRLVFSTTADGASSPTERMRIANDGVWSGFSDVVFNFRSAQAASASNAGIDLVHSATNISNGTLSFRVWTNGNVVNTNSSYGAISDIKLKENIVDANSQWSDIKALRIRNYNFKPETGHETHKQLGLIAQEVELVSPGLVSASPDRDEDGNETGEVTKSVAYSVLYMKAVKALQEAMERIEALEADVAALKGA